MPCKFLQLLLSCKANNIRNGRAYMPQIQCYVNKKNNRIKVNMDKCQEKIYGIENRVAELKFLERNLIKERDIGRLKSLDKAEKSETVEKLIADFFINLIKLERKDLIINSFPSKFSGRNDEEFLSEVKIELRCNPDNEDEIDYNELILYVYLNDGFQDDTVKAIEKRIMDRLVEVRKEIEELKETKKSLKKNG